MPKWVIEIDTDNVSSVVSAYTMLGTLIQLWKRILPNDEQKIQLPTQESKPETPTSL